MKKIIVISQQVKSLPYHMVKGCTVNVFSFESALSKKEFMENALILVDRVLFSTNQIYAIEDMAKEMGAKVTYFIPESWSGEDELLESYKQIIFEHGSKILAFDEVKEVEQKLKKLTKMVNISKTVQKLIRLAQCPSIPFGEKRNAVDAAFRLATK